MNLSMCGAGLETDSEWKKKHQQQAKNRRLLERMAPELEAAKEKLKNSPWFEIRNFPRGGVIYKALPKPDRQQDVRRIPESFPRELGWRTVKLEDESGKSEMRVRRMIGNRNGSAKAPKPLKKIHREPARSVLKHMTRLESLAEISAMEELEKDRQMEIAQHFEEDGADSHTMHPLLARKPQGLPTSSEKPQEAGYYPYYY